MEALVPEWAMPLKLERTVNVGAMAFGMKSLPAARRRALDALKPFKSEIGIFS